MKAQSMTLGERNFVVNYEELESDLWRATTVMKDDIHEIKTWLDIRVPALKVENAGIEFTSMPFDECRLIEAKAQKLIGVKVTDLGFKNFRLFLGKSGCPNAYLLFGLAGPAFYNIYHLNLVSRGKLSQDTYNKMMKNDCIAHKELLKK